MAGAVIIGFINIFLILLLIRSIYNALRHKKGMIFRVSCWLSPIYAVVTKTLTRKYVTLFLIVGFIVIYTLHQKGIIGMHLLE